MHDRDGARRDASSGCSPISVTPDVALLDGGYAAWLAAGHPVSTASERPLPGSFSAHPVAAWRADADDVERARRSGGVVLDVRTQEEWQGATPYFESRGGHIPGAVHLEWRELLDATGKLDPEVARERVCAPPASLRRSR